jgi:hypothetical protein
LIHSHPAPIDDVLQGPHPGAFGHERAARRDGVALPSADQREVLPLRTPSSHRPATGASAQVRGKWWPGPHREYAGFLPWVFDQRRTVAGGEYVGVIHGLQRWTDGKETPGIVSQSRAGKPGWRGRVRRNQHGVRPERRTALERNRTSHDFADAPVLVKFYLAFSEDAPKRRAHPRVVRAEDFPVGDQSEREFRRVPAVRCRVGQQARTKREHELDASSSTPDHRDPPRPVRRASAVQQRAEFSETPWIGLTAMACASAPGSTRVPA